MSFSRWAVLASALVCAVAAPEARATPSLTELEGKKFHARGDAAYDAGRYADAVANYREAYKLEPKPALLYNIAYCEELLDQLEASYLDYQRFIAVAPEHKKRPDADAKLTELAPRIGVTVEVTSNPTAAAIFVDDATQQAARTPATLKLPAGHHRLRLTIEHAAPREVEVEAKIGVASSLDVLLSRHGSLDLFAEPADARIARRDQPTESRVGRYHAELAPGDFHFTVTRAGYQDAELDVSIAGGEDIRQRVVLVRPAPRMGRLLVNTSLADADITVDAQPAGAPGAQLLSEGPHFVTVERPGFGTWRDRVAITAGQTTRLDVALAAEPSRLRTRMVWTLGGVGLGSLLVGGVFGVLALRDQAAYDSLPTQRLGDRAGSRALAADLLFGVGGAALIVAAVLHWTGSHGESHARRSPR